MILTYEYTCVNVNAGLVLTCLVTLHGLAHGKRKNEVNGWIRCTDLHVWLCMHMINAQARLLKRWRMHARHVPCIHMLFTHPRNNNVSARVVDIPNTVCTPRPHLLACFPRGYWDRTPILFNGHVCINIRLAFVPTLPNRQMAHERGAAFRCGCRSDDSTEGGLPPTHIELAVFHKPAPCTKMVDGANGHQPRTVNVWLTQCRHV